MTSIIYGHVFAASVCSWQIYLDDCDGICPVLSPGYPGTYPPHMECFYHITTLDPNTAIQLHFHGVQRDKPRQFHLKDRSVTRSD